jgi:hypothetical protein
MKRLLVVLMSLLFIGAAGLVLAADAAAPAADTAAVAPAADAAAPAAAAPAKAAVPVKAKVKAAKKVVKKAAKPAKPAEPAGQSPGIIKLVKKPLNTETGMAEFAEVPSIKLTSRNPSKVVDGKVKDDAQLSADLRLATDGKKLYLACDVTQDRAPMNKMNSDNIWNSDCLELYLSSKSGMADVTRMKKSEWDYQLVLAPTSEKGKPVIRNFPVDTLKGAKVKAFPKDKGGYIMTAVVPLANFKDCDWALGKTYKFDAAIAKAGAGGGRECRIWWNAELEAYDNPSQWGVAEIK